MKSLDEVIAEGERFLERSGETPQAVKVRQKIAAAAFQRLTELRKGKDWIGLEHNPEICRYAKVVLLCIDDDLHKQNEMNQWVDANLIGEAVLGHAPPGSLEEERVHWRKVWKSVESPEGDTPPWDFIELSYYVRQKNVKAVRRTLGKLAQRYPKTHRNIWWGTQDSMGQPAWKVRLGRWLKLAGDPEWKTWEPSFGVRAGTSYGWGVREFDKFLRWKFNPAMTQAWNRDAAPLLVADKILLESERFTKTSDRIAGFRPLLSAGGFMWLCQPAPSQYVKPGYLLLAPMEALKEAGGDVSVKLQSVAWPSYLANDEAKGKRPEVRSWTTTVEQGIPAVWIGTAKHGLARFDFAAGRWKSRWYVSGEGVRQDILMVRPCLHAGKPKLLILSQKHRPPGASKWLVSLWVLDPANGDRAQIASSDTWNTTWYSPEKMPRHQQLVAVWEDGSRVPLRLYSREDFPRLDAGKIVGLERTRQDFVLSRDATGPRVWGASLDGLTRFDGRMKPQWTPKGAPRIGDIYYYAPGTRGRVGVPGASYGYDFEAREREYYPPLESTWKLLRSPPIDPFCFSGDPTVGWSACGTCAGGQGGCVLLTAYKPADKTPPEENDAWYGPWRTDMAICSLDMIDGYLWLVTSGGRFHRFRPEVVLRDAEQRGAVRSTAAWRPGFHRRVESSWRNAVRKHIVTKEYDQALSRIANVRREMPKERAASAEELDFWEALANARKGELAVADQLYNQLAENANAEPFIRGMALFSLANLRYSTQDWRGLEQVLDKLVSLFPSLNKPSFSCRDTIQWYREQASKGRSK